MDRRAFLRWSGAAGLGGLAGLAGLGAAVATAGCLEGQASTGGDWDVGMTATAFDPRTISVEQGATVVWFNNSTRAHTVTAYDAGIPDGADFFATGAFDSEQAARDGFIDGQGRLLPDQSYEHTFEVPGTYQYFCIPHERAGMVGTVQVGASTA